ncbi:SpoIIE family protein phosphatase [Streptomyces sp. NPDC048410]|uniref:SpoIIE family protein phosphatase n=1 Tax=Streptomyces sp. NPDC048410 TaxID=3365545 RepID=UPI00371F2258
MNRSADDSRPLGGTGQAAQKRASLLIDTAGTVVEWSAAAEELLGYPAELVVGRPLTQLLGDGRAAADDVLVRHRDGGLVGCRIRLRREEAQPEGTYVKVELLPGREDTSAVDRALLDALFNRSPIGLCLLDPELRLTRFNAAADGMQGIAATHGLGLRPTEAWPTFSAKHAEQVLTTVLETGEPVLGFEKTGRPPGDPDTEHVYSAAAFRLEDEDGRVLGVADTIVDVTDHHRAQQRLALTAEAGTRIGTTLDGLRTATELAEMAVPRLADSVTVDLLEPVLTGQDMSPSPGQPAWSLRRAASRCRQAGAEPGVYAPGEADDVPGAAPAAQALIDRRPRLVREVEQDSAWVHGDPGRGAGTRDEKVRSLMVVPLVVRDSVLGLVTLYRWSPGRAFDEEDLALAQDLAVRAAIALDNARLHLREHNAVLTLQRGLLPRDLPAPGAVEAGHHMVLSGAGGDWTDVIALPGARVALVVGRTPGRGMGTAATMGRLRTAVHTLAALDLAPDEVMARLDDHVRQMDAESADPAAASPVGTTCLYLVYDPVTCRCTLAAAGQAGLAVLRPDGTVAFPEFPAAEPLGRPGPPFARVERHLPEGSRLALFTPGLLQAFADDTGRAALARVLAASSDSVQSASMTLTEQLVPADPPEDAAVLIARTRSLDPSSVGEWELPSDPAAVATARSLATRQLDAWGLTEELFATELIVSELVTNAIRYARPPVHLRLINDRRLTCEVSDGSSSAPHLRHARTTDEGGRGLLLVSQLAERWGARYENVGKIIWAEQPLGAVA